MTSLAILMSMNQTAFADELLVPGASFHEDQVQEVLSEPQEVNTASSHEILSDGEVDYQNAVRIDCGKFVELPKGENLYKEGYRFAGWNTDPDAATGFFQYMMPGEDTKLYAVWIPLGWEDGCTCGAPDGHHAGNCPLFVPEEIVPPVIPGKPMVPEEPTVPEDSVPSPEIPDNAGSAEQEHGTEEDMTANQQ